MKSINVSLKSIFARGNPFTITAGETGLGLIVLGLYVPDQVALGRRGLGTKLAAPNNMTRVSVAFQHHLVYVPCNIPCERFSCFFREYMFLKRRLHRKHSTGSERTCDVFMCRLTSPLLCRLE